LETADGRLSGSASSEACVGAPNVSGDCHALIFMHTRETIGKSFHFFLREAMREPLPERRPARDQISLSTRALRCIESAA